MREKRILPAVIDPSLTGIQSQPRVDHAAAAKLKMAARLLFLDNQIKKVDVEKPSANVNLELDKRNV